MTPVRGYPHTACTCVDESATSCRSAMGSEFVEGLPCLASLISNGCCVRGRCNSCAIENRRAMLPTLFAISVGVAALCTIDPEAATRQSSTRSCSKVERRQSTTSRRVLARVRFGTSAATSERRRFIFQTDFPKPKFIALSPYRKTAR